MARTKGALNKSTRVALAQAKKGSPPMDYLLGVLNRRGATEETKIRVALGLLPYFSAKLPPLSPEDAPEEEIPLLSPLEAARTFAFLLEGARRQQESEAKRKEKRPAITKHILQPKNIQ